jgi:TRAP-type uncharacterized transport system fused permease subunit
VICLALGLVTGPILLTGLGTKLPALLAEWSGGHLWLLLIGAFVASLVLGAGIPTSMAYVIVALLLGSAMAAFGVPKLTAHLFVFYGALAASITPPVALTAYAAATIAGADFWRTGWYASWLGIPKYFVPFAFVYRPELLMDGRPLAIVGVTALTLAGLLVTSYASALWGRRAIDRSGSMLFAAAGFALAVLPVQPLLLAGAAALLALGLAAAFVARRLDSALPSPGDTAVREEGGRSG